MDAFLPLIKELENDDMCYISISKKQSVTEQAIKPIEYFYDFVFCLDITGGMDPLLRSIREVIANLYNRFERYYSEYYNKKIASLRVKIIAFRDVYCDGKYWLETSDFFILPSQTNELLDVLSALEAKGGGDDPESALEALVLAMKSDWIKINDINTQRTRHVIILCTDAAAHAFEESKLYESNNYPHGMPESYKELLIAWNGSQPLDGNIERTFYMDKRARRLFIFAPEGCYPWDDICEDFEACVFRPVEERLGSGDINAETMLDTIFLQY